MAVLGDYMMDQTAYLESREKKTKKDAEVL
jgi:hypothetical protein